MPLYSRCQLGSKRNRGSQTTRKTMPFSSYTPAIGTKRPHKRRCKDMRPFERAHQMCLPNEIRPRRAFRTYLVCGKLKWSVTLNCSHNQQPHTFSLVHSAKWRRCRKPHPKAINCWSIAWWTLIHRKSYSAIAWRHSACSTMSVSATIFWPTVMWWCSIWKACAWAIWRGFNWDRCGHSCRTFRKPIQHGWRRSISFTHRPLSIRLWCWSSHWLSRKCCRFCSFPVADRMSFSTRTFCQRWEGLFQLQNRVLTIHFFAGIRWGIGFRADVLRWTKVGDRNEVQRMAHRFGAI